jgi:NAD(P)-dependent dehydrogenase (short-subunit alcohol dehydrogenase family)
MELRDQVAVVTGGGGGIGAAMCRAFVDQGARGVVIVDRSRDAAEQLADDLGGRTLALVADVGVESSMEHVVAQALDRFGAIDLFCSNAGSAAGGGLDAPDSVWEDLWRLNVLAHVYAARAVLPTMVARGSGYLLQTVSAAGLLSSPGNAPYAVTKHAALGLAEWLALTYRGAGIRVSCLCPRAVRTDMLRTAIPEVRRLMEVTAIEPEAVADAVLRGLREERFLILSHPEVGEASQRKAADPDRWIADMATTQASMAPPWPIDSGPAASNR